MSTLVLCSNEAEFDKRKLKGEIVHLASWNLITSQQKAKFERTIVTCDVSEWGAEAWDKVRTTLHSHGKLYVAKTKTEHVAPQDFFKVYYLLKDHFVPVKETRSYHILALVETLTPDIVTPDVIVKLMKAAKPLDRLFNHKKNPAVCGLLGPLLTSGKVIGSGNEGEVYYVKDWWSEVVIKRVSDVEVSETQVIDDPIDGAYTSDRFGEMLGGSLLDSLLDGTNENGYLFQVQRYVGFFTCGEPTLGADLYLINEKMDGDLKHFFDQFEISKFSEQDLKVILWQSIFALVCLSKLNYYHHDSSPQNFLYREIQPGELFLGAPVGSSETWTFGLEDQTWKLPNVHLVSKTTDFGFLRHLEKPYLLGYQDPSFRVDNAPKGFADVNYFMACLVYRMEIGHRIKPLLKELLTEWLDLLSINKEFLDLDRPREGMIRHGHMLPTLRMNERYDKWNPLRILSGPFFADIVL